MFGRLKELAKASSTSDSQTPQEIQARGDESLSRGELLSRLEALQQRNDLFELRFRDVVAAYKSLLKEKEALEATVQVLTTHQEREPSTDGTRAQAALPANQETAHNVEAQQVLEVVDDSAVNRGAETGSKDVADSVHAVEAESQTPSNADAYPPPDALDDCKTQHEQQQLHQHEKEELVGQLRVLKASIKVLTDEKNVLAQRFRSDKIVTAEKARQEVASLTAEHERVCAELTGQLESAVSARDKMSAQNKALIAQNTDLNGTLEQKEDALLSLKKENGELRKEVAQLRAEFESKLSKTSQKMKLLQKKEQESRSQTAKEKKALKELEDLRAKLNASREAEIAALAKANEEAQLHRDKELELTEQISQLRAKAAAAEHRAQSTAVIKMKTELISLEKDKQQLKLASEEAEKTKEAALVAAQRQVADAEQKLEHQKQQFEKLRRLDQKEIALQESRMNDLAAMMGKYEQARLDDQKELRVLQEENKVAKDTIYTLKSQIQEMEAANPEDADSQIRELKETIAQLRTRSEAGDVRPAIELSFGSSVGHTSSGDGIGKRKDGGSATEGLSSDFMHQPSWVMQEQTVTTTGNSRGSTNKNSVRTVRNDSSEQLQDALVDAARQEAVQFYNKANMLMHEKHELERQMTILLQQKEKLVHQLAAAEDMKAKIVKDYELKLSQVEEQCSIAFNYEKEGLLSAHKEEIESLQTQYVQNRTKHLELLRDRDLEIMRLRRHIGSALTMPQSSRSSSHSHSDNDAPATSSQDRANKNAAQSHPSQQHDKQMSAVLLDDGQEATPGERHESSLRSNEGKAAPSVLRSSDPVLHLHELEKERQVEREAARSREKLLTMKCDDLTALNGVLNSKLRHLQEEVRRLERNSRREGANLEYLKNIVLKYMCSPVGRDGMVKAISTVLQFSAEEERKALKSSEATSWW